MNDSRVTRPMVVGITGASGAPYAARLLRCLVDADVHVHLVVSPHGKRLLADELDLHDVSAEALTGSSTDRLTIHQYRNVGACIASGSYLTDGMIICPCSSNTLGAVAAGSADNLLHRAAAVTLKEVRRLVLVPREMPMNRIDLLNCLRLQMAGAIICPASPGFYMSPASVGDLVDFVVGKVLDLVHVPHRLNTRWADRSSSAAPDERAGA